MSNIKSKLMQGNKRYLCKSDSDLRINTAKNGQHPYAIIVCCSDSRVIPEKIFDADLGDLFVIRVAGNVLDKHQIGSIEYATEHLNCNHIIILGHTGCGAVHAAISGNADGFIKYITDEILLAACDERDENKVCALNVMHAVNRLNSEFDKNLKAGNIVIQGALYDIVSGEVHWL
ncbi:MAG: carbonic anhydrase [Eubacteriales bacterium]